MGLLAAIGALALGGCSGDDASEEGSTPEAASEVTSSEAGCDLNALEEREARAVATEWAELHRSWLDSGVLLASVESYDETLTSYSTTGPSECVESDEFDEVLEAWVAFHAGINDDDEFTPTLEDGGAMSTAMAEWRESAGILD